MPSQTQSKSSSEFSSQQRLKKPAEFKRVYQSKHWGGSQHYVFNVAPTRLPLDSHSQQSRIGITVAKKVSRRAVDRNRIKRQIREFYRHRQTDLQQLDIVITAKPSCLSASDADRVKSLQQLWHKILKWQHWYQHKQ